LLRADISPALDRVVQKAMAKDPVRRFQTAGAFYDAFVSAIADGHQKSSLDSLREVSLFDDDLSDDFFDSLPKLPIAQPVVRLLPLRSKQPLTRYPLLLFVICLLVLSVAGTTTVLIIGHSPAKTATTSPHRQTLPKDKLTYTDQWPSSGTFFFDSGSRSYHVRNVSPHVVVAPYYGGVYGNFRLRVTASEINDATGHSGYYGITFRGTAEQSHYYLFEIAPDEDSYSFLRYDGTEAGTPIKNGSLPISLKSNTPNTITVEARGNMFTFFVNDTLVAQPMSDPSETPLSKGRVGLCVEDQGTEVAFSQLYIDDQP
jgi:hypothetical protein